MKYVIIINFLPVILSLPTFLHLIIAIRRDYKATEKTTSRLYAIWYYIFIFSIPLLNYIILVMFVLGESELRKQFIKTGLEKGLIENRNQDSLK